MSQTSIQSTQVIGRKEGVSRSHSVRRLFGVATLALLPALLADHSKPLAIECASAMHADSGIQHLVQRADIIDDIIDIIEKIINPQGGNGGNEGGNTP